MQKVFVSYRLKPGVTMEQYKAWSQNVDQRITPTQKGVIRFEIYAIEGTDAGEPYCQVMEDIEVTDWAAFQAAVAGPGMAYIMETLPHLVDEATVKTVYGSKITPFPAEQGARPALPDNFPASA